jgi:protocatechuate 3,4-dioxygenase, alpha subunit
VARERAQEPAITPSQTVGPFFHDALLAEDQTHLVHEDHPGAIRLRGTVYDGEGRPVPDAMLELWQADPEGRYGESGEGLTGFGRSGTGADGSFEFVTVKPGRVPGPEGAEQAPHILVSAFARGLLKRLVTRIYFPDEHEANAADPVLSEVDEKLRSTLIARPESGGLRFDVRLQDGPAGEPETVFFDV